MATALVELLGPSLVRAGASRIKRFETLRTEEVLAGASHVGLLFAAEWSEESARFCERLAAVHRQATEAGHSFQLVLVSSDRTVEAFCRTLASGPWTALPYSDALRTKEAALLKQFKLKHIPALTVLAADGSVLNPNARDQLLAPDSAEHFPWPPPSLEEALGDSFCNHFGDRVRLRSSLLGGSHLLLFFASPASAACRALAPALRDAQARARHEEGAGLEVVYVPCGASGGGADDVSRLAPAAPWLTFADEWQSRADALQRIFEVDAAALPRMVLLDSGLGVMNPDCLRLVAAGAPFPWRPRLVWDADEKASWDGDPGRPGAATLVLLAERAPDSWRRCEAALAGLARDRGGGGGGADGAPRRTLHCMLARETHGLGRAVRRLARLAEADSRPACVLLDLKDRGAFYVLPSGSDAGDAATLRAFVSNAEAGAVPRGGGGAVQTIMLDAALSNPSVVELYEGADVSPLEATLQCLLCPITCPLLCAFRCCMGCCLLTFLGGAMATGAMGGPGGPPEYGRATYAA